MKGPAVEIKASSNKCVCSRCLGIRAENSFGNLLLHSRVSKPALRSLNGQVQNGVAETSRPWTYQYLGALTGQSHLSNTTPFNHHFLRTHLVPRLKIWIKVQCVHSKVPYSSCEVATRYEIIAGRAVTVIGPQHETVHRTESE
jgi:hypothetical protein